MIKIILPAILLLLLLFPGCKNATEKRRDVSEKETKLILDSISRIGRLVLEKRVSNLDSAVVLSRIAVNIAAKAVTTEAMVRAYTITGNAWSLSMMDSAFIYYSNALELIKDSSSFPGKPMLLYNIAMLHVAASNLKTAVQLLDSARLEAGKFGNYEVVSNVMNALGNIYTDLGNDSLARKQYDSALRLSSLYHLPLQSATALGNLAKLETDPGIAASQERMAMQYLENCRDGAEQTASILINSGMNMNNPDSAILYYNKAVDMINAENAPLTLLAAYNNMVYSYLDKGQLQKAEHYLVDLAFPLARKIGNLSWTSNLYDTYADVMIAEGRLRDALKFEKKSIELSEDANRQAADKQVRLLGVMLDLKNKETIAKEAIRDSEQSRSSLAKARLRFAVIILLALFLVAALSFLLVRIRASSREKMFDAARKIILVEENEKAVLGRDLHDLTGHKLLNFMNFMESASFKNTDEQITGLRMLSELQDQLKKISHRFKRNWLEKFSFSRNLEAICAETIRFGDIDLAFTQPPQYPELPDEEKLHLYRIVQELLTNASKYARKSKVALEISLKEDRIFLKYADQGPGFNWEAATEKGIGIINIYERVRLMNGAASLDSQPGYGVTWEISVPLRVKKTMLEKFTGGIT
ncbi:MAG: tetratricopeptide repeat-containing sensor histidine kinase [Bacteroidales bacterium]